MLHHRRVNAGHFLGVEGKDIPILSQEVNKGASGFFLHLLAQLNCSIGVSFLQGDFFYAIEDLRVWAVRIDQS